MASIRRLATRLATSPHVAVKRAGIVTEIATALAQKPLWLTHVLFVCRLLPHRVEHQNRPFAFPIPINLEPFRTR